MNEKREKHGFIYLIRSDLSRLAKPTFVNFLKLYFRPAGSTFQYNVWLRALYSCKKTPFLKYTIGLPTYLVYIHMGRKYGIFANSNIYIGPGLMFVHGGAVYLNCNSIGNNFTVYQGVTLGNVTIGDEKVPIVKNNVTIYTGAVIAGDVVLNDNCTVAANSYVRENVSTGDTVGGLPAKVIKKSKDGV